MYSLGHGTQGCNRVRKELQNVATYCRVEPRVSREMSDVGFDELYIMQSDCGSPSARTINRTVVALDPHDSS